MNKEEVLKEIHKTKEYLANMEKMLKECEHERWKPEKNEVYYFVNSYGVVEQDWNSTEFTPDMKRYNAYNSFKTKEQAKIEAEKILVRRMLENVARRLNKGKKIDYKDNTQCKFCLTYNIVKDRLEVDSSYNCIRVGAVHCLAINFCKEAIQEIGEERLKKYLRGE